MVKVVLPPMIVSGVRIVRSVRSWQPFAPNGVRSKGSSGADEKLLFVKPVNMTAKLGFFVGRFVRSNWRTEPSLGMLPVLGVRVGTPLDPLQPTPNVPYEAVVFLK